MRNKKIWLGMVFGMIIAGCSDYSGNVSDSGPATVILINQYSNPITEFDFVERHSGLNISQNNSQTFYYDYMERAGGSIFIFAEGLTFYGKNGEILQHGCTMSSGEVWLGKTTTITLTSTGNIIYTEPQ